MKRHKISDEFEFRSYLTSHFMEYVPLSVQNAFSSFSHFDWIFVKVTGNVDRHKNSNNLETYD